MKTACRTRGAETLFMLLDLTPAEERAAEGLQYAKSEDGYGRTWASDTPHLPQIYANFRRDSCALVQQAARLAPIPWERALTAFLAHVEGHGVDWWLTGSAALAVRGVDIEPGDFDLITDAAGAHRLGELLLPYQYEPVVPVTAWISGWFGRAFLHARFEWAGELNESVDQYGPSDCGLVAASRLETVKWRGHALRVPPLDLQREVSLRRGLTDRVARIDEYVSAQQQGTAVSGCQ